MLAMSTPAAVNRVLLVTDRARAGRTATEAKVRRYRLARVQLNGRAHGTSRHEHLRRSYD
jgi:hypothetical protein